ncbi:MAG: ATP-binding protein [Ruminiclostridium sp.]|nr:ATP-binding protein [Ruminiclostridium sp.]
MEVNRLYSSYFDFAKVREPYTDNREALSDLFSYLDLCFTLVTGAKGFGGKDFPSRDETGYALGLSVSSTDLGELLLSGRREEHIERLSEEAAEQIEAADFHIRSRNRISSKKDFVPRYEVVAAKFRLNEFERFALLLALSVEYDRKYEAVYTYLHNNSSDYYPTKWLAVKLYRYLFGDDKGYAGLLDGSSPLCRFLCDRAQKRRDRGESAQRLTLSPRVTSYILGRNDPDRSLSEFCRIYPEFEKADYVPVRTKEHAFINDMFLSKAFKDDQSFAFNIHGPVGVGRKYAANMAVNSVGLTMLDIDLYKLICLGYDNLRGNIDSIFTEVKLLGAIPCFTMDAVLTESDGEGGPRRSPLADKVQRAAEYISSVFSFFFWITPEKSDTFIGTETRFVCVELPMLTANERKLFWDRYLPGSEGNTIFSNQYILTPSGILRTAQVALDIAASEGTEITRDIIYRSVRQQSVNQLGSYATRINAVFTWDDLVIGDDQKRKMKMICDQVKYRSVVNEDWGFRKKSPYGRGLCALFYGSPGTGKTMAVQVMANELGIDLYRIDLSQLSSKYIGETQKNISALFDKAKNINAMLFFDEADSMFAKRSEVKDSNDRYANADTAFLLQKLEDYEGITILATNYVNNIDDAFKRRIKFMINFVFPTADVRLTLWKKILPTAARIDEPIDFEFFAENFELSGSNIKEILTNAAFMAASEGGGIRNSHIIEAVKLNFSKYGKTLNDSDFGYLGK